MLLVTIIGVAALDSHKPLIESEMFQFYAEGMGLGAKADWTELPLVITCLLFFFFAVPVFFILPVWRLRLSCGPIVSPAREEEQLSSGPG